MHYLLCKISSWILLAARHPSAALIIVWRNLLELVVTSHAAYSQAILVACLLSTTRHHSSSFKGFIWSMSFVKGIVPTATKIPSAFSIFQLLSFTSSIKSQPLILSTSSCIYNSIFALFFAWFTHISSALKVSLL